MFYAINVQIIDRKRRVPYRRIGIDECTYVVILPHVSAATNVNGFDSKRVKFDMCTKENRVFQDVKFLLAVRF